MKMVLTLVLTVILFVLGIVLVLTNPFNAMAISFGMFLIAISILNVAIQMYFPSQPITTVELKVVQPEKNSRKRPAKKAKKTKKTRKK